MNKPTQSNRVLVPPRIAPVATGLQRPLWSVMIPTFNCAKYLRQTLECVLDQDPGPERMQIEVVDDCSTKDDPEAVVKDIGKGRVAFYCKPKNGGAISNFNTCIERSNGHLVHILHGDDYVTRGFYEEILGLKRRVPDAAFFGCRNFGVDEDGVINWVSPRIPELESGGNSAASFYYGTAMQFCGVVIRRDFFEKYGGFLSSLVHTSDCEMWTRAISLGGGIASSRVLSNYRMFSSNDTSKLMQTAENIRDLERLHECFASRFSDFESERARTRAAKLAREQGYQFLAKGNNTSAEANFQMYQQLKRSTSWIKRLRRKARLLRQAFRE